MLPPTAQVRRNGGTFSIRAGPAGDRVFADPAVRKGRERPALVDQEECSFTVSDDPLLDEQRIGTGRELGRETCEVAGTESIANGHLLKMQPIGYDRAMRLEDAGISDLPSGRLEVGGRVGDGRRRDRYPDEASTLEQTSLVRKGVVGVTRRTDDGCGSDPRPVLV